MLSPNGLLVAFTLTFKQDKTLKDNKIFQQSKDVFVGRPFLLFLEVEIIEIRHFI